MVYLIQDKASKAVVNTVKANDMKDLLDTWDYSDEFYDIHSFSSTEEAVAYLDETGQTSDASAVFM